MEIKINLEKPKWSKKTWYIIGGCVLAIIILVSFLIHYNSQSSEVKRQAEQYVKSEVASMIGEEVLKETKVRIDKVEKRAEEETADEVIYDTNGTFTHPDVLNGTDETITEYIYFYVQLNKIQKTWGFGQIHPDESRE